MIEEKSTYDRLDEKTTLTSNGDCWPWIGAKGGNGYGVMSINGKMKYAHRLQYERWNNAVIPSGCVVMHSCDNPSCVNPLHLSIGTQRENINDAMRKGRMASGANHGLVKNPLAAARGEMSGGSKLTEAQVSSIRDQYVKGTPNRKSEFSLSGLSRKYGVSFQTISKIINKDTWK